MVFYCFAFIGRIVGEGRGLKRFRKYVYGFILEVKRLLVVIKG